MDSLDGATPELSTPSYVIGDIVKLNVGGTTFMTAPETLLWCTDSFFSKILSGNFAVTCDDSGAIFIDRDPLVFRCILTFLRSKKICLSDGLSIQTLKDEAEYFNLQPLRECVAPYSLQSNHMSTVLCISESSNSDEGNRKEQAVVAMAGDNTGHLVVAYANFFCLFNFSDTLGWTLKHTSSFHVLANPSVSKSLNASPDIYLPAIPK
ncbi:BTB/POZ domain-containing protein kctd3 [Dinochytrium kinnereticum]|nr:BTB/POZ domain-containing protein kctd3 [Dinochytrium kinnereticum]